MSLVRLGGGLVRSRAAARRLAVVCQRRRDAMCDDESSQATWDEGD